MNNLHNVEDNKILEILTKEKKNYTTTLVERKKKLKSRKRFN